ncbi:MAG: PQQ-binding-like beta-propeller repeat protein [Candidatus Hydrogenedens sp.]|jgi:outer membrane protein assembly factor BamB|nr:PQQ-binding-like beta-propeller repeat protein [Candidatus Hydrogenedens sp.]
MKSVKMMLLCLLLASGLSVAAEPELVWQYESPAGHVDASPALGALEPGGDLHIVATTTGGLVLALTEKGEEVWRSEVEGPACVSPAMGDLDGDGNVEIVVLTQAGNLYCLDAATGRHRWKTNLPGRLTWGETAILLADLSGQGRLQIITGDAEGNVVCVSDVGEQLWVFREAMGYVQAPAAADLTGDGLCEVLVAGPKIPLICLNARGEELWRIPAGTGASPVLCDLDGDGIPEIITGIDEKVVLVNARGEILWDYPMRLRLDSAITVTDLDGDGVPEIIAVDLAGDMVCLSAEGQKQWDASVVERVRRSPSVGDINGDGILEILVAGYSGYLHVFQPDGSEIYRHRVAGGGMNGTPTLVPLSDGGPGVLVTPAGAPMSLLRFPGAGSDAARPWPEYRQNARRTTMPLKKADESQPVLTLDTGNQYVGANVFRATVNNAEGRELRLSLEGGRVGGAPLSTSLLSSEEEISVWLSYAVPAGSPAHFEFGCTVHEGDDLLVKRSREFATMPFMRELGDSEQMLREIQDNFSKMSDIRGLEERAFFLEAQLDKFRPRFFAALSLSDDARVDLKNSFSDYQPELQALHALVRAAVYVAEEGGTILAAAANPWAPFGGMDEIREGRTENRSLSIEAFPGEHESAAFNFFNMSGDTRIFRVTLSDLVQGDSVEESSAYITLHEAVPVPTEMINYSVDALPELNNASLLQVAPWSAAQLWLDVNTAGLAPGEWLTTVTLTSVECEPVQVEMPVVCTLFDTPLPEEQPLSLCHWGYVDRSMLKHIPEKALEDQVSHGTNVFVGTVYPQAKFDEEGKLIGAPDFTAHDAYVKAHAPHGRILFFNYQNALKGPGDIFSEAYGKAHVQWLRLWVAHLRELGVGYDGFALYPVDEPGLSDGLVERHIAMAKLARQADPDIMLYTDPVARISLEELEALLPFVDIWCPHRNGILLDESSAEKFELIRKHGKIIWTYECDDNVKHHSPLGYYRAQAWLVKSLGLTGIGFWSYCTSQDDPWFRPGIRHDYLMIYPGTDVVTSKRWEAVRDGIEDFTLLDLLTKKAQGAEGALKAEVESFLTEQVQAIARYCGGDEDGTLPGPEGMPGVRRVTDKRWEALKAARREMARYLSLLP